MKPLSKKFLYQSLEGMQATRASTILADQSKGRTLDAMVNPLTQDEMFEPITARGVNRSAERESVSLTRLLANIQVQQPRK